MLNAYEDSIPDGSYVFKSYPGMARRRSSFYKMLATEDLKNGIPIFIVMDPENDPFDIDTNPTDYGACYITLYSDANFTYVLRVIDHFSEAAASEKDPSLLYDAIQDFEADPQSWDQQLAPMYKIPISDSFIVVSCTAGFVTMISNNSTTFADAARIRTVLASFVPVMTLTSDDFNQQMVSSTVGVGGALSQAVPAAARSSKQLDEDELLGNIPQTAFQVKRSLDAGSLRPLAVICRNDYDRLDEILCGVRSIKQENIVSMIQSLFSDEQLLTAALGPKLISKLLTFNFVAYQSGSTSSISTGDFPGLTIGCFQKNQVDPLSPSNIYVLKTIERPWQLEKCFQMLEGILNRLSYSDSNPDYSMWTLLFQPSRAQLTRDDFGSAAKEPGPKIATLLVHHFNKALVALSTAFEDSKKQKWVDQQWISFGRDLLKFDNADLIAKSASAQVPKAQFSNSVIWKKAIVADNNNKNDNPLVNNKFAEQDKKRKRDDDAKAEKLLADKKKLVKNPPRSEQICIHDFEHGNGFRTDACKNNKGIGGKCERLHIKPPVGGGKWDHTVLDKVLEGVKRFDSGPKKDALLANINGLR